MLLTVKISKANINCINTAQQPMRSLGLARSGSWKDSGDEVMKATKKQAGKFQIQYRYCGMWANGNTYLTHKEADNYARHTGRDYQIVKVR